MCHTIRRLGSHTFYHLNSSQAVSRVRHQVQKALSTNLYLIRSALDVGRHAILAALEKNASHITVITSFPEKLNERNWDSYGDDKTNPFDDETNKGRLEMVKVDSWTDELPSKHFEGADAVVSCLGHRQPGWKYKELISKGLIAYDGNSRVIRAMGEANVQRVVTISSFGLNGDRQWKHPAAKAMTCLFKTFMWKAGKDLTKSERAYQASSLDYLIVRPVGIGEEVEPCGEYYLQEEGEDVVGGNMAKMDCARFMVDEAMKPTLHRASKVVGSKPGTPM